MKREREFGWEPVEVPSADDMEDETFLKHLEKRHAGEVLFEKTPVSRGAINKWLPSYRVFHQRLHDLATPGQHDHEHEEEW